MLRPPRPPGIVVLGIVLPVLLGSCASQFESDVFFTPGVDFTSMTRLAFSEHGAGTAEERAIARKEIERILRGKGFRFTETSEADLLLHYTMGMRSKVRVSGRSTQGRHAGLAIEFVDPDDQRPLWHGLAYESWFDAMDPATEIRKAVELILSQFPPPATS